MDKKAIDHLATNVMEWQCDIVNQTWFFPVEGKLLERFILQKNYNPFENIEQAMMLLDKFKDNDIELGWLTTGVWKCSVFVTDVDEFNADGHTCAEAICNAVLQATGYEDSHE